MPVCRHLVLTFVIYEAIFTYHMLCPGVSQITQWILARGSCKHICTHSSDNVLYIITYNSTFYIKLTKWCFGLLMPFGNNWTYSCLKWYNVTLWDNVWWKKKGRLVMWGLGQLTNITYQQFLFWMRFGPLNDDFKWLNRFLPW